MKTNNILDQFILHNIFDSVCNIIMYDNNFLGCSFNSPLNIIHMDFVTPTLVRENTRIYAVPKNNKNNEKH